MNVKSKKENEWTDERIRAIADYYDNQPDDEAVADVRRFFEALNSKKSAAASGKKGPKSGSPGYSGATVSVAAKAGRVSEARAKFGKSAPAKPGTSKSTPRKET